MNVSLLYASIRSYGRVNFSRSGGAGGQNVNKVSTQVCLRIRLGDLAGLSGAELDRLRETLASRITTDDEIVIKSNEERSQRINLERAYSRLESLVNTGARLPKHRRPARVSPRDRENRLQAKRRHSQKKSGRKFRPEE
ncbi:MAG: aminoacyl-tRNA hydrolase [Treponema sp.]|jgi:ribosome-associated protein|nr:aminoacyl-tRNA hydrolase [Treponema sp.]